jgi:hypothetical protein
LIEEELFNKWQELPIPDAVDRFVCKMGLEKISVPDGVMLIEMRG